MTIDAAPAVASRPPTVADVVTLVRAQEPPVVAAFVPLVSDVPNASGNALRLRHVAEALDQRMGELALSDGQCARVRERLAEFFEGAAPPPPGIRGRGAVLANGRAASFGIPSEVEARAYVGRCVPARALLRAAEAGRSYRIVAISANRVRVAVGDARGVTDEPTPELPASLVDALGAELERTGVQFHNVSGSGSVPLYHGHHGASAEREVDRERYHRVLAEGLVRAFAGTGVPIVWVADKTHRQLARELASRIPIVGTVDGSSDHWSERELHDRAWPLVLEAGDRARDRERGALERARGRGEAALGRQAAIEGVLDGRARRLWVPAATTAPGRIDQSRRTAVPPWGDEELLDELACLALRTGAEVRVAEGATVLPDVEVAAELR